MLVTYLAYCDYDIFYLVGGLKHVFIFHSIWDNHAH